MRRVLLVGLATIVLLLSLLGISYGVWQQLVIHPEPGDFFIDLDAGGRVLRGEPLYAPDPLAVGPRSGVRDPYLYPPFMAVALAPLSVLPYAYVGAAWVWATVLSNLAVALGLARLIRPRKLGVVCFLAFLGFLPQWAAWAAGNVDGMLFTFCGAAYLAARRGRDGWAGAALGLGVSLKLYPAFLLVYLLGARRFRAIWSAAAVVALTGALTLPVVGLQTWWTYAVEVVPTLGKAIIVIDSQSLASALGRPLLAGEHPEVWQSNDYAYAEKRLPDDPDYQARLRLVKHFSLAVEAAALLMVLWLGWRKAAARSGWAAGTIALIIAPSVTWFSRYAVMPLAFATLLEEVRPGRIWPAVVAGCGYVAVQLILWPITTATPSWLTSLPVYAALGVLIGALALRHSDGASSPR